MKKLIIIILLLFTGCGIKLNNKPTKQVEIFLTHYQTLNEDVIEELNNTLNKSDMTENQKEKYKKIIKNHYKNLTYEIKDEEINGNNAVVKTEIEVFDYTKLKEEIEKYYQENENEFKENDEINQEKYMDYKLEKLSKVKQKTKYIIEFTLTKINDEWKLNKLSEEDEEKILGIY